MVATPKSFLNPFSFSVRLPIAIPVAIVGLTSRSPILCSIDKGIKFILAPRSSNAFPTGNVPIVTGIVKLPGSLDFWGNDFWIIALHPASSSIVSSENLLFFVRSSFMNFAYVDICSIASTKGILICNRLKMSMNLANCLSLSFLEGFWGYGRLFNWGTCFSPFSLFLSSLVFFFFFFFSFIYKLSFILFFLSLTLIFFILSLFFLQHLLLYTQVVSNPSSHNFTTYGGNWFTMLLGISLCVGWKLTCLLIW